uniref:G-protein coupled receptors family 1 profile domain-containing protein n=1 Tax=Varanus komodoensis TaxID=61221 RepID=A0A8D2ITH0_VARKO
MPGAWPAPNSSSGGSAPAPAGQGCAAGLEGHLAEFSAPVPALLAVLMGLAALATVLGNALVALAFVVDRSLRTHRNFFFLNLAIADFMVGAFCIPLYIPYTLTGKWMFGRGLCKLWLVIDYVVCAASVFNIVLISFDRLISVTKMRPTPACKLRHLPTYAPAPPWGAFGPVTDSQPSLPHRVVVWIKWRGEDYVTCLSSWQEENSEI